MASDNDQKPLYKLIKMSEVQQHNKEGDAWLAIKGQVYDVSKFMMTLHPGGLEVMLDVAGEDATNAYEDIGHSDKAHGILKTLVIGKLDTSEKIVEDKNKEIPTRKHFNAKLSKYMLPFFFIIMLALAFKIAMD